MNKAIFDKDSKDKILVNIDTLKGMLCMGKVSANKIASDAGAVVRVGRLKMYNVQKIRKHLDTISAN